VTQSADALAAYLQERRATIDAALERALPRSPACPAIVAEAMRYSVFAGGKRLRPILTLAAADAAVRAHGGGRHEQEQAERLAMPSGCAIELIHTYSLIHDDLPAMDDDTLRRGRPTLHVVYNEGMAILAGDGLLAEAFALLAREPAVGEGHPSDLPMRKLRVIAQVATAAGSVGMVGGQAIDLQAARAATGGQPQMGAEELADMHARKTGALFRAAAVSGAIMAGAAERVIGAIDLFAAELGLAFQIVDDILDVESSAAELGKTVGKDAASGKPTYPALFGLEGSRRLAAACIERGRATLSGIGLTDAWLLALGDRVLTRRN
jgi:geranylgeranyl diphosphate synthase type II